MPSSEASSPPMGASFEGQLPRLESFLKEMIGKGRFDLKFTVQRQAGGTAAEGPGYVVNFSGPDTPLLLESNATLLDALEYLTHKSIRLDEALHHRISFDCEGYRRIRVEELRMTANLAAERVVEHNEPFSLSPMNSRDRRVIHLTLRDESRVKTESRGDGAGRHVVIFPAPPSRST
ncbi:MAG TPA: R3H domain-containing nucleic acid-binding protein [Terriglobia bacterium]|nr:R3H domain-containing nucleic acid-binding protein [Terriglobia bacterium]HVB28506.1 R3H domain-containing nucleic acid-binding protein [Terriglobia bacterium]